MTSANKGRKKGKLALLQELNQEQARDPNFEHLVSFGTNGNKNEIVPGYGTYVPGKGSVNSRLFILGEAPGENENNEGSPFVGDSGQVLANVLKVVGIDEDYYITNVLKFRPPHNRKPFPHEVKAALPYLTEEINIVNPRVICALGTTALSIFYPNLVLMNVIGEVYERRGRHIIPTWHPGAILRDRTKLEAFTTSLQKVKDLLDNM